MKSYLSNMPSLLLKTCSSNDLNEKWRYTKSFHSTLFLLIIVITLPFIYIKHHLHCLVFIFRHFLHSFCFCISLLLIDKMIIEKSDILDCKRDRAGTVVRLTTHCCCAPREQGSSIVLRYHFVLTNA